MRYFIGLYALSLLVACADPMATLPRLSESDVPEDAAVLGAIPPPDTDETPSGGLFTLFKGSEKSEASEVPDVGGRAKPKGLFGRADTALTSEIAPGTVLPYGRVARICGMSKRALGKKTAQYPERRPKHVLYDSDPGNTAPHTFYLTGFSDGCARQFTASVAVFGPVAMHEQLRYGLPAEVQPYSDTDKAYEKIKRKVCGAPRKKPCGAKLGKLEGSTVFLSIYERYSGNARWSNLLLHDGQLVAQDTKG